jgi:hypothetical protein
VKLTLACTLCFCLPVASQDSGRVEYFRLAPEVIQQRLARVTYKLSERRLTLEAMFRESGCDGEHLTTQRVPGSPEPNVICTLPGDGAATIVVGAHFDLASRGMGAVDDWSGTALLASLYKSLSGKPRRHTIVFIGFAAEETGLHGSKEYVKKLTPAERTAIRGMVNLECLGLSAPKVWTSRADKTLLDIYLRAVSSIEVQPAGVNVENVGDDDAHSFRDAKIPTITIHSIDQQTLPVLHSVRDNLKAVDPDHYYTAYRVAAAYLAYLDALLN